MNPYAGNLGNRDPLETIAATPNRLRSLSEALGPERMEALGPPEMEPTADPLPPGGL